ncbi:tetratricopeptide repeat protein [Brachyspira alvinipulli]|uniref:tetratricopeptide repeat protein n=1 Tax=Brachyspira alvinipulli TaxID=84379 RepID=UPI0004820ED4|nr:tetratricopeptide repeat protein [Brachyspira alvinipulli]
MNEIEELIKEIENSKNDNAVCTKSLKEITKIFKNADLKENDTDNFLKLCTITVDKLFYLQRYNDIIYIKENIFNIKDKFTNINDILFLYPSAISNLMLGFNTKAIKELEELINNYDIESVRIPPLQNFLAEAYLRDKKFEKAAETYEKFIHIIETNAMMWNDYGYALECLGKIEEAKNAYSKSLELDPKFIFAKNNLKKLIKENILSKIQKLFNKNKQNS